MVDFICDEV